MQSGLPEAGAQVQLMGFFLSWKWGQSSKQLHAKLPTAQHNMTLNDTTSASAKWVKQT